MTGSCLISCCMKCQLKDMAAAATRTARVKAWKEALAAKEVV